MRMLIGVITCLGNLDMLRSMYDFKATYAKTLSFKANEYFILHQTVTKHKNWWEVINERGEMGFVPSNYVETITVSPGFYLQYLDNCMESIKNEEISPEYAMGTRKEVLLRLKEMKRQIENLPEVHQNSVGVNEATVLPPLLFRNSEGQLETTRGTIRSSTNSSTSFSSTITEVKKYNEIHEEPIKPIQKKTTSRESFKKSIENIHEELKKEQESESKKSETSIHGSSVNTKVSPIITSQSVYELVESVRINTQLSHEMSKVAVQTVIQGLHDLLPASAFPYLSTILSHCQTSLVADDVQIDQTHDASRLKIIFNELTSCKEDSQQRSWMLHEDETVIKEYISELISILVTNTFNLFKVVYLLYFYYFCSQMQMLA